MSKLRELLTPQVSPFRKYRHEIIKQLQPILKSGDILLRDGQHYMLGVLPFSRFVQWLTNSKYAHCSLVYENIEEPLLAEISNVGMQRQFLIDWLDEVYGKDFLVLRCDKSTQSCMDKVYLRAKELVRQDPFYNVNLNLLDTETLYCVQFVYECYRSAGIELAPPLALGKLPNWNTWCKILNKFFRFDENQLMYFVGNKDIGLMSSNCMKIVCKVSLKNFQVGMGIDLKWKQHEQYQSQNYLAKNLAHIQ